MFKVQPVTVSSGNTEVYFCCVTWSSLLPSLSLVDAQSVETHRNDAVYCVDFFFFESRGDQSAGYERSYYVQNLTGQFKTNEDKVPFQAAPFFLNAKTKEELLVSASVCLLTLTLTSKSTTQWLKRRRCIDQQVTQSWYTWKPMIAAEICLWKKGSSKLQRAWTCSSGR